MTREQLEQLARDWRLRMTAREVLYVGAGVCVMTAIAALWLQPAPLAIAAAVSFVVALTVRLSLASSRHLDAKQLARHLDRAFPQLEESSALWLRPLESLTLVERLQRARADDAVRRMSGAAEEISSFATPPRDLLRLPLICLAAALVLLLAGTAWRLLNPGIVMSPAVAAEETGADSSPSSALSAHPEWPRLQQAELRIVPPAYTGRAERSVSGLNADVEEGSQVAWTIRLEGSVREAALRFGPREDDLLPLRDEGGAARRSRLVTETLLYNLSAEMPSGAIWRPHELYSLKVIKDRPPGLKIVQPVAARTEVAPPTSPKATPPLVALEVLANDDYGVADAFLVATVAKGTGEAVKFREQKIPFDANESGEGPAGRRLVKTLDLLALGLEPGDELYFHVEASDNRQPAANRARSETRFVILKGPEQTLSAPGSGVSGINLVPQYFRSQRQIIIDTEKLIADEPTLSRPEFSNRANNLAIDQQLLRQRYGEFLGEEAEHGAPAAEAHDNHEQETHSPDDGHDHGHEAPAAAPQTQQEVAAQFGHQHDSQDEATLFDRETKGTMRQALAAMWEAERFLRMAQPREALAPENRALEIIKALQQADRSYVQRVGFEAAPIDFAGRRMRGDVSDVRERLLATPQTAGDDRVEDDVRELLRLAPWRRTVGELSALQLEVLQRVEPALVAAANNDTISLGALEELRRLASGGIPPAGTRSQLEPALLRLLGTGEQRPRRREDASPALGDIYFRSLEQGR